MNSGITCLGILALVVALMIVANGLHDPDGAAHSASGTVLNVSPEIRGVSVLNNTLIVTCFDANGASDIVTCTINGTEMERTESSFSGDDGEGYVVFIGRGGGIIRVTDDNGLTDTWDRTEE